MMRSRNAVTPVVATALLLVVAVVSVVGFQNWFVSFSSGVLASTEGKSSDLERVRLEIIDGNGFAYIYNALSENLTINKMSSNGIECISSPRNLTPGTNEVNIAGCLVQYENVQTISINIISDESALNQKYYLSTLVDGYPLTSCMNTSSLQSSGVSRYVLRNNISMAPSDWSEACFYIGSDSSSGVTIDCNGYSITSPTEPGSDRTAIHIDYSSNNVIQNCIFEGFNDDSSQSGVHIDTGDSNIIRDSTFRDNHNGIRIDVGTGDAINNIVDNIVAYNNTRGVYFGIAVRSNIIRNSNITGNIYNLYFDAFDASEAWYNDIYGNYLGTNSSIVSSDWAENTPNFFNSSISGQNIGNYWDDLTCTSNTTVGSYTVCTSTNYTINTSAGIIDYRPLLN